MLESQFGILENSLRIEKIKLDSASRVMEQNANVIDNEKRRTPVDQNKLTQMMASSVPISNAIKEQQKAVARMEEQLAHVQARLLAQYSAVIDSLTGRQTILTDESEKQKLEDQIHLLSEKRLFVSPLIKSLSFDPYKIRQIQLQTARDSVEYTIYKDYLERALKEINFRIDEIKKSSQEVSSVLSLRRGAGEFLEEVIEQNSFTNLFTAHNSETNKIVGLDNNPLGTVSARVFSVANLLKQLNDNDRLLLKFQVRSFNSKIAISMQDYLDLLSHTEKELAQYKRYVQQKLR